jgi:large subunit ribosomal protein L32
MAVPKKRQSNTRRNMRRANHDRRVAPTVVECSNCSEPKLPHRVCPACGFYNGQSVVEVAEE